MCDARRVFRDRKHPAVVQATIRTALGRRRPVDSWGSRHRSGAIRRCPLGLSRRRARSDRLVGAAARPVPSAQHALDTPGRELDTFSAPLDTNPPAAGGRTAARSPHSREHPRRNTPNAATSSTLDPCRRCALMCVLISRRTAARERVPRLQHPAELSAWLPPMPVAALDSPQAPITGVEIRCQVLGLAVDRMRTTSLVPAGSTHEHAERDAAVPHRATTRRCKSRSYANKTHRPRRRQQLSCRSGCRRRQSPHCAPGSLPPPGSRHRPIARR